MSDDEEQVQEQPYEEYDEQNQPSSSGGGRKRGGRRSLPNKLKEKFNGRKPTTRVNGQNVSRQPANNSLTKNTQNKGLNPKKAKLSNGAGLTNTHNEQQPKFNRKRAHNSSGEKRKYLPNKDLKPTSKVNGKNIASQPVKGLQRAKRTAGKVVKNTGKAMKLTGKGIEKGSKVAGKGMQTAGKGAKAVGDAGMQAGKALSSTGVGAIAGVPLMALGGLAKGAGTAGDVAGKGLEKGGGALGKGLQNIGGKLENAGKKLEGKNKPLNLNEGPLGKIAEFRKKIKIIIKIAKFATIIFIIGAIVSFFTSCSVSVLEGMIETSVNITSFEVSEALYKTTETDTLTPADSNKLITGINTILNIDDNEFKEFINLSKEKLSKEAEYRDIPADADQDLQMDYYNYNNLAQTINSRDKDRIFNTNETNRLLDYFKAERKSIIDVAKEPEWFEKIFDKSEPRITFKDSSGGTIATDTVLAGKDVKKATDSARKVEVTIDDVPAEEEVERLSEQIIYNMIKPYALKWQTLYFFDRLLNIGDLEGYVSIEPEDETTTEPTEQDKELITSSRMMNLIDSWLPKFEITKYETTNTVTQQKYTIDEDEDKVFEGEAQVVETTSPVYILTKIELWNKTITSKIEKSDGEKIIDDWYAEDGEGVMRTANYTKLTVTTTTKIKTLEEIMKSQEIVSNIRTDKIQDMLEYMKKSDIYDMTGYDIANTFEIQISQEALYKYMKVAINYGIDLNKEILELPDGSEITITPSQYTVADVNTGVNVSEYTVSDIDNIIQDVITKFDNLDINFVKAIIATESSFQQYIVSKTAGARGYMQLMPGTFNGQINKYANGEVSSSESYKGDGQGRTKFDVEKSTDPIYIPYYNILAGSSLISEHLEKYNDPKKALAAYNRGSGKVDTDPNVEFEDFYNNLPTETQDYIPKVLSCYLGFINQSLSGTEKEGTTTTYMTGLIKKYTDSPEDLAIIIE